MKKIIFATIFMAFGTFANAQNKTPLYKQWATPPKEFRPQNEVSTVFPFNIALKDTTGAIYNSAEVLKTEGKPLVLMFWLTTCGPCKMELEAYKANYEKWQKETDFRLVVISTDFPQNAENYVKRTKQAEWQFESYHDYNREFGFVMPGSLNGLPQVFVMDGTGKITYHHRRFIPGDEIELFAKIKEASLQMKSTQTTEVKGGE